MTGTSKKSGVHFWGFDDRGECTAHLQRGTIAKVTPDSMLMTGYADMIGTPELISERQELDDLIEQCDPGLQWEVEQYFMRMEASHLHSPFRMRL
jgi:hypothetical protein